MGTDPAAFNGVRVVRLPVYVDITNAADVRGALDDELQDGVTVLLVDLALPMVDQLGPDQVRALRAVAQQLLRPPGAPTPARPRPRSRNRC